MKRFTRFLICLMICCCLSFSCTRKPTTVISENGKKYPIYLYQGSKWDVVQINDSILTLIPGLNGSGDARPVVVNINSFNEKELEN